MKLDKVVWCDRGFLPTYYGFCPSEAAWKREMRRLGAIEPYPDTDGRCCTFENTRDSKVCVIVTIGERIDAKRDPVAVVGLIVHEAAHVWQSIKKDIREENPSPEFEAYALQFIVMQLLDAYATSRGVKVDV